MTPESSVLIDVAEGIADGTSIDWQAAETRASVQERPVIQQLRVLSELAGARRSQGTPPLPSSGVAPVAPQPNPTHWGHLQILGRLGSGTYADVYRAWDPHLEREVALKLLRTPNLQDGTDAARIAREGRLLARIRHQHVISVYGMSVQAGQVGLWMELVQGATLEQTLVDRGWFSARETILIGIELCGALAAVHGAGLVHRDVKTQNVVREDGGRIVLMDMGAGQEARSTSQGIQAAGTPLYLPPEAFTGAPPAVAGDIYSLGVLLFRLVTGGFPIAASTLDELRAGHAHGRRRRLRDVRPDLPAAFVRTVDRALAQDPAERHESAGALERDLLDALDAVSGHARAAGRRTLQAWRVGAFAVTAVMILLLGALATWRIQQSEPASTAAAARSLRSIAVLPFSNSSGDAAYEYLVDGLTDEVIERLGRVPGLVVISRASIMQFKESARTIPDIARALGVDAVLHGAVLVQREDAATNRRRGVRVSARLIAAGANSELWNRTFEATLGEVLTLQGDIALAVVDASGIRLDAGQRMVLTRGPEASPREEFATAEAMDLYLQGRFYWHMRTEDGLRRSIQYFNEALQQDPRYARAYAGIADAYAQLGWQTMIPMDEAYRQARAAALEALKIDPELPEALSSLAVTQMRSYDWTRAGDSFRRALRANPNQPVAHYWYSMYLTAHGRLREAAESIDRARLLDPLSPRLAVQRANIMLLARQADQAAVETDRIIDSHPKFARAYLVVSDVKVMKGDLPAALAAVEKARELGDTSLLPAVRAGRIHALAGRRAEALAVVRDLESRYERLQFGCGGIAMVFAALGDRDSAFAWLERARERRDPSLLYLLSDPAWDPLRSDPRFGRFVTSMGITRQ